MGTIAYYYTNVAIPDTVGGSGVSSTDTSLTAGSLSPTGYPQQYPFKLRLDPRTPSEEVVKVTAGAGTVASPWTIVRGWDGTLAAGHDTGAAVEHGMSQEDLALSRAHEAADSSGTFISGVLDPSTLPHGLPSSAWQGSSLALISSVTLSSNQSIVTFSAIPQTYTHLLLVAIGKTTDSTGRDDNLNVTINGDGSGKYSYASVFTTDGTSGGGSVGDSFNAMPPITLATSATSSARAGGGFAFFPGYSSTTFNKMAFGVSGMGEGTSSANASVRIRSCFYNPATQVAITSLSLASASGSLKPGTTFSLYGIA